MIMWMARIRRLSALNLLEHDSREFWALAPVRVPQKMCWDSLKIALNALNQIKH